MKASNDNEIESEAMLKLHAFVDGELPADEMRTFEKKVAADPALQASVLEIKDIKRRVKEAFTEGNDFATSHTADDALSLSQGAQTSEADQPGYQATPSKRFPYSIAAAVLLGLAAGILGSGYYQSNSKQELSTSPIANQSQELNWLDQMANYQAMYYLGTLEHVAVDSDSNAALQSRIQATIDPAFSIPDLSHVGLEFKRGQFLKSREQAVVQLAYLATDENNRQVPVAICFTPKKASTLPEASAALAGNYEQLDYLAWHTGTVEVAVMAELDAASLERIKVQVAADMGG